MKRTLCFALVLLMLLSIIPFASAANEYNDDTVTVIVTASPSPIASPDINHTEVVVTPTASPTITEAPNALENSLAEDNVIVQKDSNGKVIQTTLDEVTPTNICSKNGQHEKNSITPSRQFYESKGETGHVLCSEYVCGKCGMNFLEYGDVASHRYIYDSTTDTYTCENCKYVKQNTPTATASPTSYSLTTIDENGERIEVSRATFKDGTLTISSGTDGSYIPDYVDKATVTDSTSGTAQETEILVPAERPWKEIADQIKTVIVNSGISRIGDWSLAFLENLKEVFIEGYSTVEVGDFAFAGDESLTDVNVESSTATLVYDNADATVIDQDETYTGSTAYYGDGDVSVNYRCNNKNTTEQEKTQFANANVSYGCIHANVTIVAGTAATETEPGLTEGQYCRDCKTWIVPQTKIYPYGKAQTGTFEYTNLVENRSMSLSEIFHDITLTGGEIDTIEDLLALFREDLGWYYKNQMQRDLAEQYRRSMPDDAYVVYAIKETTGALPDNGTYIFNVPYPQGTYPSGYKYVVLQLKEDGTTGELNTLLTANGIQLESSTLLPIGISWIKK